MQPVVSQSNPTSFRMLTCAAWEYVYKTSCGDKTLIMKYRYHTLAMAVAAGLLLGTSANAAAHLKGNTVQQAQPPAPGPSATATP